MVYLVAVRYLRISDNLLASNLKEAIPGINRVLPIHSTSDVIFNSSIHNFPERTFGSTLLSLWEG
jgi:hypothetical protein